MISIKSTFSTELDKKMTTDQQ